MKTENQIFNILCMYKPDHAEAKKTAFDALDFFHSFGIHCFLMSSHEKKEDIAKQAELAKAVLVFGGDGTMLATARALHSSNLPLFGFNFGRVGFLMEGVPKDAHYWFTRFLSTLHFLYPQETIFTDFKLKKEQSSQIQENTIKPLFLEEHNILKCDIMRDGQLHYTSYAINDAVVSRMNIARAISLTISIDTNHLTTLRCDGFIVASPLGATGYALSAHGPLALPGLEATILTPICPFASSLPPCVVASSSTVNICAPDPDDKTILTLDGQENVLLEHEDIVSITAHSQKMKLLISDKAWYSKRLVERGFIRHTL